MKLWRHMRSLWPRYTLLPPAPFVLWAGYWALRGQLRWEQLALAVFAVATAYGNTTTKRLYLGLLPMGLLGWVYDAMRFVQNVGVSETRVHVCDVHAMELRWFGIHWQGQPMTLSDFFRAHASLPLDILCAIPYGLFLFVPIGYAIYLYFRGQDAIGRFAWGFFLVNILGFITYHLYPAAPPWYFHQYGCAVDLATPATEGLRLANVDAFFGMHYFAGLYGRSSDVFGAIPSLHVAYPMLMVIEGWRHHRARGRAALVGFYFWMCFSAVYLEHHWVLDIAIGSVYAIVTASVLRKIIAPEKSNPERVAPSRA